MAQQVRIVRAHEIHILTDMLHKVDLSAHRHTPSNAEIADALDNTAQMLDERGANPHRVQAYRTAADTIRATPSLLADCVYAGGAEALEALPGVGTSLAQRIAGFVHSGEMRIQRELREQTKPERLLMRVPGIGRTTSRRLREEAGIETLEALEIAAHDGTLAALPGFGDRKLRSIQAQLDALLARSTRRDARRRSSSPGHAPHVSDLLSIDAEYRDAARQRDSAPHRAASVQCFGRGVASRPRYASRSVASHRVVLQHATCARTGQDGRLGRALHGRRRWRTDSYGRDRNAR